MRERVVIIGGGFGGLFATKALRPAPVDITLISTTSNHVFQPLLYQVATGILSTGEIGPSLREILRRQRNVEVLLGHVANVDLTARTVTSSAMGHDLTTPYDRLIVAAGVGQSYFGNDQFARFAPGLKSIDDALELRGRILTAFELAELEDDPAERRRLLTFVVVGAGPTGVEMAGQIAELATRTLQSEFRRIDPAWARVILLEGGPKVLGTFGPRLARKARRQLERMGVDVRLSTMVTGVDATGVEVRGQRGDTHRIESVVKVWAAGVEANPLAGQLAAQSGAKQDRSGRIEVEPDLTLPGHPEVFVVGDLVAIDGVPGVAPAAIQMGQYAAARIMEEATADVTEVVPGRDSGGPASGPPPFRYHDKGSMATISRFGAIAKIGRFEFSGFVAWFLWLFVHLLFIAGFKNQVSTLFHWAVSFLGRSRAQRTTTERLVVSRLALAELGDRFRPTLHGGDSCADTPPTPPTAPATPEVDPSYRRG